MFKKLFGSSQPSADAKKTAQPVLDPHAAMNKLDETMNIVQTRIRIKDNQIKEFKNEALQKNKAKDQRGRYSLLFSTESIRCTDCHAPYEGC